MPIVKWTLFNEPAPPPPPRPALDVRGYDKELTVQLPDHLLVIKVRWAKAGETISR
jgi:hypothetical protein